MGWSGRNTEKLEGTVLLDKYYLGTYHVTGASPGIMTKTATSLQGKRESCQHRITAKCANALLKDQTSYGGFPGGPLVKSPPASAGDAGDSGEIPGSGRSPGEGNGNPLQYSCLGNPMDRGAWRAAVHGLKELDMTE